MSWRQFGWVCQICNASGVVTMHAAATEHAIAAAAERDHRKHSPCLLAACVLVRDAGGKPRSARPGARPAWISELVKE
jgi:hypothetical protein